MCTLHPFPLKSFVSASCHLNWRVGTVTLKTRKKKWPRVWSFYISLGPQWPLRLRSAHRQGLTRTLSYLGEETCLLSNERESRNRMKLHPPQPTIQLLVHLLFTQVSHVPDWHAEFYLLNSKFHFYKKISLVSTMKDSQKFAPLISPHSSHMWN